uniref:Transmembrane protein 185A n=1 Tax=Romanomermis culicivorax TaxID=13658 RepID=A0A915JAL3_ROMCU
IVFWFEITIFVKYFYDSFGPINVIREYNFLYSRKVVVFACLFSFLVLFALKEDRNLSWPYWATLIPLWIWKTLAITGGIIGCIVFRIHPPNRNDLISHREYKAMILSFIQHFLLLIFELLVCFKLDFDSNLLWLFVFVPLLFQSLLAIPICVWSQKKGRNYEFEIVFAVNVLQFVFLALKLDAVLMWPWVVIFIPLWILICMSLIIVLYAIVSAILMIRSPDLMAEQRRTSVFSAINHTLLVVPILIFLVLLTNKLDGESQLPYLMVFTPLYVSLMCLIVMACGSKGGNQCKFTISTSFSQLISSDVECE